MNKLIILICFALFLVVSCKKDTQITPPTNNGGGGGCSDYLYENRSSANFDSILDSLTTTSIFGSTYFRQEPIIYTTPRFNPNNDYEICYIKDLNSNPNGKELWKYNFCNNVKSKITDNIFYSLDWSIKDWIIYTGNDQHIYKVKSNGDSLTKLTTNGGIHAVGKWSPDGTMFWYIDGGTTCYVCNENGGTITTFPTNFKNIDWFNNSTLLVNWGGKFCKFDYSTQVLTAPINSYTVGTEVLSSFNAKKDICLWENYVGQDSKKYYLLRWDFTNNNVDTIRQVYHSYHFISADYNSRSNKIIAELYRAKWLNQTNDWIQFRNNIVIMNPDGSNERILDLK
jgi:hypothetical protein